MATLSVPPPEREQTLRSTAFSGVFFWGAFGLLLVGLLAYVLIVWIGVDHFTDADAARVLERQKILQDRVTEDYKYLHDKPSYFKKEAGLVRVPIDEAMRMTLADLQKIKPHPAYPIAQSPPQNSSAPTSPDKGAGQNIKTPGKTNGNAPAASNPTVGQASPAPVAPSTTPAPVTAASNAAPAASAAPSPTPAASNNANNPGNPPVPGAQAQPPAPAAETNTSGTVVPATPVTPPAAAPGAQAAPLTNPPAQPTPEATATPASSTSTPTPNPQAPGASPAGTP